MELKDRSEIYTLYILENISDFKVIKLKFPKFLNRKDLRLNVDNLEDLVVCRKIYNEFKHFSLVIPLSKIVSY